MNNRWQLLMQCNGDAAIDQCLDAYEQALEETGLIEDLRPVLVHCQTIREDQLDRIQHLGILPSFFHDHVSMPSKICLFSLATREYVLTSKEIKPAPVQNCNRGRISASKLPSTVVGCV